MHDNSADYEPTGIRAAHDVIVEVENLQRHVRAAPIMTLRSDMDDFHTAAQKRLNAYIAEQAKAAGLPAGDYGMHLVTGEFMRLK